MAGMDKEGASHMRDIEPRHLEFAKEAAAVFAESPRRETHWNHDETLIAFRFGLDRDCVHIYELGDRIANFVQMVPVKLPAVRNEVDTFARGMERQLQLHEYKGGWENESKTALLRGLDHNLETLRRRRLTLEEFKRRCANIANYAMMLADNEERRR